MVSTRMLVAGLVVSSFALVAALAAPASNPRLTNEIQEPVTPEGEAMPESSPQCPYSRKGGGVGGNSASCEFTCTTRDLISIKVSSADPDAEVSGNGSCGGAGASCAGKAACTGTGTRSAGSPSRGTCNGSSSEAWRSAITVDCEAAPASTPCNVAGVTCEAEVST